MGGRERNFSHLISLWRLWYHSWLMISQVCFWLEIPSDPLLESSLCSPFLGVFLFLLKYKSWHWDGIGDASKIWKIRSFRHIYQEVLSAVIRDSWLAQYTDSLQRCPGALAKHRALWSILLAFWCGKGGASPACVFYLHWADVTCGSPVLEAL